MYRFLSTAVSAFAAAWLVLAGPVSASARDTAGDFDFYVLSLSWAPTYCAGRSGYRNKAECGPSRPYGFVVHGLWPQGVTSYPEACPTRFPMRVPSSIGRDLEDIMPGMSLVGHEWRKHGTCSGLDQASYFRLVRKARESITIPAEFTPGPTRRRFDPHKIEAAFVNSNAGLRRDGIAVTCRGDQIEEVHICLTKSLQFRSCPTIDATGCHRTGIAVPGIAQPN